MITKAPGPDESIELGEGMDPVLSSYYRLMRLKRLYRQGWLKRGIPREICESVAEHSFGTAILALLLTAGGAVKGGPAGSAGSAEVPAVDPVHAALLALVHEMGESYAGDITPVDGVSREEKLRREREAIDAALAGHPEAEWFISLWEEFEACESPEARFVKQLDRLEMGLEASLLHAEGFPGMEEFLESSRRSVKDPGLRALLEEAVSAAGKASAAGKTSPDVLPGGKPGSGA